MRRMEYDEYLAKQLVDTPALMGFNDMDSSEDATVDQTDPRLKHKAMMSRHKARKNRKKR